MDNKYVNHNLSLAHVCGLWPPFQIQDGRQLA